MQVGRRRAGCLTPFRVPPIVDSVALRSGRHTVSPTHGQRRREEPEASVAKGWRRRRRSRGVRGSFRSAALAINRDKVYDGAMKLLAQGKFDKGIAELAKLVVDDPKDVRTLLKIAETLHVKMGKRKEALEHYDRAASLYTDQGFFLKAVAVFKQMLAVDGTNPDLHLRLAELYQQLGYGSQCLLHYQQVVVLFEQQGRSKETLGILKRMVDLDPENLQSRIKVAELFHQQGMAQEAVDEMRQSFEYLRSQQRFDDAVRVGEKVCAWDVNAVDVARELGQIYMDRGDAKSALAKLQLCFRQAPRDLELLGLIASAFLALNQVAKSVSVYKEMARIHEGNGDATNARHYWEQVLEYAPGDDDAEIALGRRAATVMATAAPAAMAPRSNPEDEAVQRLLTETDVYVKYGLREKAIEHLDKIFALRPEHLPALEKLRTLQNQTKQPAAAYATLKRMVAQGEVMGHPKVGEWQAELARTDAPAPARPAPAPAPAPAQRPRPAPAAPLSTEGEVILVDEPLDAPPPAFEDEPLDGDPLEDNASYLSEDEPLDEPAPSAPPGLDLPPMPAGLDNDDDAMRTLALPVGALATLPPVPRGTIDDDVGMRTMAVSAFQPKGGLGSLNLEPPLPDDEELLGAGDDDDNFDDATMMLDTSKPPPGEMILEEPADDGDDGDLGADADALVREALGLSTEAPPIPGSFSAEEPFNEPSGALEQVDDELILEAEELPPPAQFTDDDAEMLDALAAEAVNDAARSNDPFGLSPADMGELASIANRASQEGDAVEALAGPPPPSLDDDFSSDRTVAYPGADWQAKIAAAGIPSRTVDDSMLETGEREAVLAPPMASQTGEISSADVTGPPETTAAFEADNFNASSGFDGASDGFDPNEFDLPDDVKAALARPEVASDELGPLPPEFDDDVADSFDALATGTYESGHLHESQNGVSNADIPSLASVDAAAVIEVGGDGPFEAPPASVEDVPDNVSQARALFAPDRGFEDDPANTFFPDELAEAEFFIQQELFDEAREILEPILEEIEDSERVKHMLARVAAKEAGEPEPPAPWERQLIEDVAAEILDAPAPELSDPGQVSVEEVLSQFKKGIAETVPEDDAATHYDLGIAYREMGLLDDAVGEFEVAARAPTKAPDSWFLVALVRLEQGRADDALIALERAVSAPGAAKAQKAAAEYQRAVILVDHLNRGADALVSLKRSQLLGGNAPDLDRRMQSLMKAHSDVDLTAVSANESGRPKNIDYV